MNQSQDVQGGSGKSLTKLVFSVPEAGALLGLGRSSSYEAARRGDLPTIKIGRRYAVPKIALERLLESAGQPKSEAEEK